MLVLKLVFNLARETKAEGALEYDEDNSGLRGPGYRCWLRLHKEKLHDLYS
jgi:hypothetical protein